VPGLTTPAATGVGGGALLAKPDTVRGIHRITRHPFLWGVAIWAVVHLVFNTGVPERVFFGTFLLVAVAGTFSIDAKRARRYGESWPAYARQTSNFPFVAIVQGRNQLRLAEIGLWRFAAVLGVFALVLALRKPAGVRTHALVAVGAALIVMVGGELGSDGQSRVIQGLITGIGFLGAGVILHSADERKVHGLTTAAAIWVSALLGAACAAGSITLALAGFLLVVVVLLIGGTIEKAVHRWLGGEDDAPP
jgi:hypothetical protein